MVHQLVAITTDAAVMQAQGVGIGSSTRGRLGDGDRIVCVDQGGVLPKLGQPAAQMIQFHRTDRAVTPVQGDSFGDVAQLAHIAGQWLASSQSRALGASGTTGPPTAR